MVGLTAERNMQKTAPVDDIPRLVEGAVFINRLHAVASAFEYLFGYVPDVAMQLKWKGNLSMKKNPVLILAAFAVMLAACNSTVTSKETTKVFNEPATYRYTCSEDMDWYSTITVKE